MMVSMFSKILILCYCCCLPLQSSDTAEAVPGSLDIDNAIEDVSIDSAFDDVLSDPEFRRLQRMTADAAPPGWFEEFIDWMFGGVGDSSSSGGGSSPWLNALGYFLYYLVWGLALTALSFVGWILIRAVLRHFEDDVKFKQKNALTQEQVLELSHPPGEIPSNEYERRAMEFASSGNYKSAVRELVLGSMSWIERAGFIRYRKGLTNRDYVRAVWRKPTERGSLEHIVSVFERAYFGRRTPDRVGFELCLENYQRAFISENVLVET